jgi:UDP-N-acetyl-2-amino-2-deoxyglucuronate dehydrogenase
MRAIRDTGNVLTAAVDPSDSVGVLDSYFPTARFFTEIERFDRHLEKLRRTAEEDAVEYVSLCSPNYLHDAHVRLALRVKAHAICEKPLVINPWNLDQLAELEAEFGRRVYTVMQLRHQSDMIALKERLTASPPREKAEITLTYVTQRGQWYDVSWKGSPKKSGGLAMNLGIHFFDLLMWLLGPVERSELHLADARRMAGYLELERARVRWFLSVDADDLPLEARNSGKTAWRSLQMDGEELEFSSGFADLHTRVYEEILAGRGLGIADARPSIELLHRIRTAEPQTPGDLVHPLLAQV